MEAPVIDQWGPALWTILHYLAERSGRPHAPNYHINRTFEEKRIWLSILSSLRICIPCPMCRTHYTAYLRANRVEPIFRLADDKWGEVLRKWFWDFHNEVRTSKNQALELTYEDSNTYYAAMTSVTYQQAKDTFIEHLRRGMFQRLYVRDDMTKCIRFIQELRVCLAS
jgi:hypothetical protein